MSGRPEYKGDLRVFAPRGAAPTAVFAHRGAHRHARENTLDAFRAAVELQVAGVELDIHRTADGVVVVHHDPVVGSLDIASTPYGDLGGTVASLAEVLDLVKGVSVNVEIKVTEGAAPAETEALVASASAAVLASGREDVGFSCFDEAVCRHLLRVDPSAQVAWLVHRGPLVAHLERAHRAGFAAVNPHFALVGKKERRLAGELGLALHVWTVNRRGDLSAMVKLGVDAVITDRPRRALAVVKAAG